MKRTVRGLCRSCECLKGRASWRKRKPQYSPPFCCKLGPKTPTFQPCQHHIARYCRTPPKSRWACSAASWLIPHLCVKVDVTLWLSFWLFPILAPACRTLQSFFIGFRLHKDSLSCHGGKWTGASNTAALQTLFHFREDDTQIAANTSTPWLVDAFFGAVYMMYD